MPSIKYVDLYHKVMQPINENSAEATMVPNNIIFEKRCFTIYIINYNIRAYAKCLLTKILMFQVTYLVTMCNNQQHIQNTISSLIRQEGRFSSEYIFVDDGSTDSTLQTTAQGCASIPHTTVISLKSGGPNAAIIKGLKVTHGKFIFFVDGGDVLEPGFTAKAIDLYNTHKEKVGVFFGLKGKYDPDSLANTKARKSNGDVLLIESTLEEILNSSIPGVDSIGCTGSMVARWALNNAGWLDNRMFLQNPALSLRLSICSNFIHIQDTVCYAPKGVSSNYDKLFINHQTLLAIYYFLKDNPQFVEKYADLLYRVMCMISWKMSKGPMTFIDYLKSKMNSAEFDQGDIIKMYKDQLMKLALV